MMRKANVQKLVLKALQSLQKKGNFPVKSIEVKIEIPADKNNGDFSTNVAMLLPGKESPAELAELIKEEILKTRNHGFSKIEVAFPGFINFFINKEVLLQELQEVLIQKGNYGNNNKYSGKNVIIEFTDPNPFKEFHVGHLYSNVVGEAIFRLFRISGANAKKACYQGDIGLHVAKAVFGMLQRMKKEDIPLVDLEKKPLAEKIKFMGLCYVQGDKAYKSDPEAKKEIIEINKKIFGKNREVFDLYEKGRKWSLEKFEEIYKRIGSGFDYYFFESDEGTKGLKLVQENLKNGIFEESQGAIIFPGEKYGLHSRVFINSHGLPTYEAKEIGLAHTKYEKFPYDLSIVITGNEVDQYFKVLIMALSKVSPDLAQKTKHISHGMVRVPEGKMSSREGNIILAENLLEEIKTSVLNSFDFSESPGEKSKEEAAEKISLGAIKYSFLKSAIGGDIIFDKEKSLSIKGGSGPYLQYATVRCKSILNKAESQDIKNKEIFSEIKLSEEEIDLLRFVSRFPDVTSEAAEKLAPNLICSFALTLAQKFNVFYDKYPILKAEDKGLREFRLALTFATAKILENALYLIGIEIPEKM